MSYIRLHKPDDIQGRKLQVLELIIFAGLAAIVLYQLYAVLGRRVGRQPEDAPAVPATTTPLDRKSVV